MLPDFHIDTNFTIMYNNYFYEKHINFASMLIKTIDDGKTEI